MKILSHAERDTLMTIMNATDKERLLLCTPILDFLSNNDDIDNETIELISHTLMSYLETDFPEVDPLALTSSLGLCLFSLASQKFEDIDKSADFLH